MDTSGGMLTCLRVAPPKNKDKKATKMGLGEFLTDPSVLDSFHIRSWHDLILMIF